MVDHCQAVAVGAESGSSNAQRNRRKKGGTIPRRKIPRINQRRLYPAAQLIARNASPKAPCNRQQSMLSAFSGTPALLNASRPFAPPASLSLPSLLGEGHQGQVSVNGANFNLQSTEKAKTANSL